VLFSVFLLDFPLAVFGVFFCLQKKTPKTASGKSKRKKQILHQKLGFVGWTDRSIFGLVVTFFRIITRIIKIRNFSLLLL
jgi:hypothetical protein